MILPKAIISKDEPRLEHSVSAILSSRFFHIYVTDKDEPEKKINQSYS